MTISQFQKKKNKKFNYKFGSFIFYLYLCTEIRTLYLIDSSHCARYTKIKGGNV